MARATVAGNAVSDQCRMVTIEQMPLEPAAMIGKPVERHHIGEVVGRHINAPGIPIEDSDIIAAARLRQKNVPDPGRRPERSSYCDAIGSGGSAGVQHRSAAGRNRGARATSGHRPGRQTTQLFRRKLGVADRRPGAKFRLRLQDAGRPTMRRETVLGRR